MSAQGTFVEFIEVKEKGISATNADLKHGKVISIGSKVDIEVKKGDMIVVSTVKHVQDLIDGEKHFFVDQNAVIKKLSK